MENPEQKLTEQIRYIKKGDLYIGKLTNYPIIAQAKDLELLQKRLKTLLQSWINLAQEIVNWDSFEQKEIEHEEF